MGHCGAQPHVVKLSHMPCAGGAKGIGYACAACLGHEGAQVVIADIDEAAAQQAAQRLQLEGVAASAFRCDVGVKDEVGGRAVVAAPRLHALVFRQKHAAYCCICALCV